jgi:hypothetical protein
MELEGALQRSCNACVGDLTFNTKPVTQVMQQVMQCMCGAFEICYPHLSRMSCNAEQGTLQPTASIDCATTQCSCHVALEKPLMQFPHATWTPADAESKAS